jgi:hypothetical protein
VARVAADAVTARDPLAGLARIGIDEISYRRGHRYLTTPTRVALITNCRCWSIGPEHRPSCATSAGFVRCDCANPPIGMRSRRYRGHMSSVPAAAELALSPLSMAFSVPLADG